MLETDLDTNITKEGERLEDVYFFKNCPICGKPKGIKELTSTSLVDEGFCCLECYPG